jgi:hypothetical protein
MYGDDESKEAECNCDEAAQLGALVNCIVIEKILVDGAIVYEEEIR